MLVISSELTLVDADTQFSLNNPIIGYENIVDFTGISASTSDASGFYPATNMANPSTNLKWKALDSADVSITIVNDTSVDLEYVGLARHNLGTVRGQITVVGSTDGGSTYPIALAGPFIPANNEPLMFRFTKANYTNIAIVIQNMTGIPQVAVCMCGPLLALQRRIYVGHTPITYARQTSNVNGMSESGEFLGRLNIAQGRSTTFSMKNLTPDWYRDYLDPFILAAKETTFFFAWRPQSYPNEIGYCWLTSDPKMVNQSPNGMVSCDLAVGGIGDVI